jgi:hypothetical protein
MGMGASNVYVFPTDERPGHRTKGAITGMLNVDQALGRLDDVDYLRRFIEGLRIAEGAARQLAVARDQKQWLLVALNIEQTRATAVALATGRSRPLEHRWVS